MFDNPATRTNRLALTLFTLVIGVITASAFAAQDAFAESLTAGNAIDNDSCIIVTDAAGEPLESYQIGNTDITSELARALKVGKGETCEQTTVFVPNKSFTISTGTNIKIYSNTRLVLGKNTVLTMTGDDAVLEENKLMLQSGAAREAPGYDQIKNVQIEGGTWDGNCVKHPNWNITGILLQHGQNISFNNITFRNFTNHAVNVAGTKNVTATNCTFSNSVQYTGNSTRFWGSKDRTAKAIDSRISATESFHTDFCAKGCEKTAYPLDGTACKNITVSKCTFNNTYSGVGTHHLANSDKMSNITVSDCTFKLKSRASAVSLYNCTSARVQNNTSNGGYYFIRTYKATATVQDNKVNGCIGNAISAYDSSNLTVMDNTIKNAKTAEACAAILFTSKSRGSIVGNVITCPKGDKGINVAKAKATIKNNAVNKATEAGIAVKQATGACKITGNKVKKVSAKKGGSGNGIYLFNCKKGKITVSKNTVSKAASAGVRIDKCKKISVTKNTITSCSRPISISSSKVKQSKNKIK